RFPRAFEDGTRARDRIRRVYDTTETIPDSHWPVPISEDDSVQSIVNYSDGTVRAFLHNSIPDTATMLACPHWACPRSETGNHVDAINWTPPMTITWDTSLFHAPYLPYSQGSFGIAIMDGLAFSAYMNHPELGFGVHDMLINDSLTVSELTDYL